VLRIQDSGDILVPHLNLVKATGRTCRELAFSIKRELEKSYYKVATVIIALEQKAERHSGAAGTPNAPEFFTIFGQVQKQGKYELPADEDVSISQAILRAGGFAQFASTKAVKVVRRTPSGNKTVIVNLEDIMVNGSLDHDIYIRNNDVIIVKEKIAQF
jgi:protein involved in polysaccharide export with SLBB domain